MAKKGKKNSRLKLAREEFFEHILNLEILKILNLNLFLALNIVVLKFYFIILIF